MLGGKAMYHRYHTIEFRLKAVAAVESAGNGRMEQVVIAPGTRLRAQVNPYVVESDLGPVEAADLSFGDGSIARGVRFASFSFVDE
jgi:hypothetical protein